MASCLGDPVVKKFDILAIQEPWLNVYTATIHHPIKNTFRLIYSDPEEVNKGTVRVCFFFSKPIPMADLKQIRLISNAAIGNH